MWDQAPIIKNKKEVLPRISKNNFKAKTPSCRVELKRIIGMYNMCNFQEFIPNIMTTVITKSNYSNYSLRELLKKILRGDGEWGITCKIKQFYCKSTSIDTFFDQNKYIFLQNNVSKIGIGCCLMHDRKSIRYAFSNLSDVKIWYKQIKKEFPSVVFACTKFRNCIYGRQIIAWTDHKPLIWKKMLVKFFQIVYKKWWLNCLNMI